MSVLGALDNVNRHPFGTAKSIIKRNVLISILVATIIAYLILRKKS